MLSNKTPKALNRILEKKTICAPWMSHSLHCLEGPACSVCRRKKQEFFWLLSELRIHFPKATCSDCSVLNPRTLDGSHRPDILHSLLPLLVPYRESDELEFLPSQNSHGKENSSATKLAIYPESSLLLPLSPLVPTPNLEEELLHTEAKQKLGR